jgi:AcrR family transcriptional regulator
VARSTSSTQQAASPPGTSSDQPARRATGNSTRERILDIALELFTEQGYDKTSLRDIAERLGTTKAALYYHFARKEDILMELHLRLHAIGHELLGQLDELEVGQGGADAWGDIIERSIDAVIANRELVLMHQRNYRALEQLTDNDRHQAENEDIEQQFRRVLANRSIPLEQRVRIACSVSAILGTLAIGEEAFGHVPITDLAEDVRHAVRDLLGPGA